MALTTIQEFWWITGITGKKTKKTETNITPENRPCQEEMASSNLWFLRGEPLASGRVTWIFVMRWLILGWEISSHPHAWTLASSSSFASSTSSKRCTSPGSCCCNVAILCENREGVFFKKGASAKIEYQSGQMESYFSNLDFPERIWGPISLPICYIFGWGRMRSL